MAAVLARGETIIHGAAREPEIVDLGEFLISLGARIDGLGTSTLQIRGVEQLGGTGANRIESFPIAWKPARCCSPARSPAAMSPSAPAGPIIWKPRWPSSTMPAS